MPPICMEEVTFHFSPPWGTSAATASEIPAHVISKCANGLFHIGILCHLEAARCGLLKETRRAREKWLMFLSTVRTNGVAGVPWRAR